MEDPWGSPWDADTPASNPAIITNDAKPDTNSLPGFDSLGGFTDSPWGTTDGAVNSHAADVRDAWGGWNDGGHALESVKPSASGNIDEHWDMGSAKFTTMNMNVDSAVSFGDVANHEAPASPERAAKAVLAHEQDAWEAAIDGAAEETAEETAEEIAELTSDVANDLDENEISEPAEEDAELERESSKVQGLVDMYDDIAKKASTPDLPLQSSKPAMGTEKHEFNSEDESTPTHTNEPECQPEHQPEHQPSSPSTSVDHTEQEELDDRSRASSETTRGSLDESAKPSEKIDPGIADEGHQRTQPSPATTTSNPKSIPYPIDFSHLDTLFPNTAAIKSHPESVSETVINDTFTNISERKTWYRISRFGSTRKHDNGDDDTYVRTTWPTSQVRHDTLKIVRGWMEQDSIAGRVVLGRKPGPLGASMFGWDSSEPQVEIGELLKKRTHHARNKSLPVTETPMTPVTGSFGWNTTTVPSTPSAVVQSPTFAAQMGSLAAAVAPKAESPSLPPSPWDDDEKQVDADNALGIAPETSRDAAASGANEVDDDDDDDDWGEMISSPNPDTSTFPPAQIPAQFDSLESTSFEEIREEKPSAPPPELKPSPVISTSQDAAFISGLEAFEAPLAPTPPTKHRPSPLRVETTYSLEEKPAELCEPENDVASTNPASDEATADIIAQALRELPDLSYMLR